MRRLSPIAVASCAFLASCAANKPALEMAVDTTAVEMPMEEPPAPPTPQRELVTLGPASGGIGGSRFFVRQALTRDQLRTCVVTQRNIDASRSQSRADEYQLTARRSQIEAQDKALDVQRLLVNARSQASVDGFNAAVRAQSTAINDYNIAVDLARKENDRGNSLVNDFNSTCGGRSYYADEMSAVLAELGPPPVTLVSTPGALPTPAVSFPGAGNSRPLPLPNADLPPTTTVHLGFTEVPALNVPRP